MLLTMTWPEAITILGLCATISIVGWAFFKTMREIK